MTFDPDNPYARRETEPSVRRRPIIAAKEHSGIGIASFVVAIVSGLAAFALILIAGVMEVTTPGGIDETSATAILVGFCVIGTIGLNLFGILLAIIGLFQSNRMRLFAYLGLLLNVLVTFGFIALFILGTIAEAL